MTDKGVSLPKESGLDRSSATNAEAPDSVWSISKSKLQGEIDSQIFSAYIEPLEVEPELSGGSELVINAPSKLVCSHVQERFGEKITSLIEDTYSPQKVTVRFRVSSGMRQIEKFNPSYLVVKKTPPTQSKITSEQAALLSGLNPKYTFDTFVVGNNSQFCHAAASQVALHPGETYNPLFIYGGVGLGKTHLLHAIGNDVLLRNPSARVLYMSSEAFTNELITSLKNGHMESFKAKFRSIELILIDDIQFIAGKERTQEEFFHTFNALYASKHQIVITSDKLPSAIPGIEDRLKTRFSWGLTADMQAPDFETRVAILKQKAAADGCPLPTEVAHYIAEKVSSNVRELEGALTRLHAVSSLQNTPVSLGMAESALKALLQPKIIQVTVLDIKKVVSERFRIKVSEMVSKRRTKNLSFPRHIAMYLCRKYTTCSYPEIGQEFGGRDHSSVIHAANVVATKLQSDESLRQTIEEIERSLLG